MSDSGGSSSRYATFPIRSRILNGPKVGIGVVWWLRNLATRGCTRLCVLPQSTRTVTGCLMMRHVTLRARGDDDPNI